MSSINFQFHALTGELIGFVKEWKKELNFHLVMVRLFPKFTALEMMSFDELEHLGPEFKEVDFIYLGLTQPNLSAASNFDFISKNPNYLSIHLGKLNERGLTESTVGGITESPENLKIWKKIVNGLRKNTFSGMWGINSINTAREFYKNARYTQGAYELAKGGKKLILGGCEIYYEIDNF